MRDPAEREHGEKKHVSETPATQLLQVEQGELHRAPYEYVEHGGTSEREQLGWTRSRRQDAGDGRRERQAADRADARQPQVSTKNLARQIGAKSVEPCKPEVAQRHSGYMVGGTSPFGTRRRCRCMSSRRAGAAAHRAINGGRRGYLVGIDPQVFRGAAGRQARAMCGAE
jgi:hypothetical protein